MQIGRHGSPRHTTDISRSRSPAALHFKKRDKPQGENITHDIPAFIGLVKRHIVGAGRIEDAVPPDDIIGADQKFTADRLADIGA